MTEPQSLHDQARELYFQHHSFRSIARELNVSHVSVSRWAKDEDWEDQLKQHELSQQEYEHEQYLASLAEVKERHLSMSRKGMEFLLLGLREFGEYDEQGQLVGIKKNRFGHSVISPHAWAMMYEAFVNTELKVLGFANGFPAPDVEKLVASQSPKVIDAPDPEWVKQLGDAMAKQSLETPDNPFTSPAPTLPQ